MSASLPSDRRPVPTVAIIGNDTALAAAPATPVQLAHACLRCGFSVAVPASWGDELVAAEAVRRLAAREKGPVVMCVCPYVRARLLAPGPDLAPFLLSLSPPPVAVARYLRGAYGERGVHITYIGECPGADDPAIDAHLTPDAFFAEIADRGIALSEQPLVFDSIVPPDRRRWCSLPGGVPSADTLWNETDMRTLVEIDSDDPSTDVAQHIIAAEHVLLDLAPSLGCACSGAVAGVGPRGARTAVTALEPPRAMAPVIDPAAAVSLDAPLRTTVESAGADGATDVHPTSAQPLPTAPAAHPVSEPPAFDKPDETRSADTFRNEHSFRAEDTFRNEGRFSDATTSAEPPERMGPSEPGSVAEIAVVAYAEAVVTQGLEPTVESGPSTPAHSTPEPAHSKPDTNGAAAPGPVRRRTPQAVPPRHPAAVPRATSGDGRLLPRAYVAKRRSPPAGVATVDSGPSANDASRAVALGEATPSINGRAPHRVEETTPATSAILSAPADAMPDGPPAAAAPPPRMAAPAAAHGAPRAAADPSTTRGVLVALLVAVLVMLGVFVLVALRR